MKYRKKITLITILVVSFLMMPVGVTAQSENSGVEYTQLDRLKIDKVYGDIEVENSQTYFLDPIVTSHDSRVDVYGVIQENTDLEVAKISIHNNSVVDLDFKGKLRLLNGEIEVELLAAAPVEQGIMIQVGVNSIHLKQGKVLISTLVYGEDVYVTQLEGEAELLDRFGDSEVTTAANTYSISSRYGISQIRYVEICEETETYRQAKTETASSIPITIFVGAVIVGLVLIRSGKRKVGVIIFILAPILSFSTTFLISENVDNKVSLKENQHCLITSNTNESTVTPKPSVEITSEPVPTLTPEKKYSCNEGESNRACLERNKIDEYDPDIIFLKDIPINSISTYDLRYYIGALDITYEMDNGFFRYTNGNISGIGLPDREIVINTPQGEQTVYIFDKVNTTEYVMIISRKGDFSIEKESELSKQELENLFTSLTEL